MRHHWRQCIPSVQLPAYALQRKQEQHACLETEIQHTSLFHKVVSGKIISIAGPEISKTAETNMQDQ